MSFKRKAAKKCSKIVFFQLFRNINIIMGENKKTSKNVLGSVMKVPTENI